MNQNKYRHRVFTLEPLSSSELYTIFAYMTKDAQDLLSSTYPNSYQDRLKNGERYTWYDGSSHNFVILPGSDIKSVKRSKCPNKSLKRVARTASRYKYQNAPMFGATSLLQGLNTGSLEFEVKWSRIYIRHSPVYDFYGIPWELSLFRSYSEQDRKSMYFLDVSTQSSAKYCGKKTGFVFIDYFKTPLDK